MLEVFVVGGDGGMIIFIYRSLTNNSTISVNGGVGGAAGVNYEKATGNAAGSTGKNGTIYYLNGS